MKSVFCFALVIALLLFTGCSVVNGPPISVIEQTPPARLSSQEDGPPHQPPEASPTPEQDGGVYLSFADGGSYFNSSFGLTDRRGNVLLEAEYSRITAVGSYFAIYKTVADQKKDRGVSLCALADPKGKLLTGFDYYYFSLVDPQGRLILGSGVEQGALRPQILFVDGVQALELEDGTSVFAFGDAVGVFNNKKLQLVVYDKADMLKGVLTERYDVPDVDYCYAPGDDSDVILCVKNNEIFYYDPQGMLFDRSFSNAVPFNGQYSIASIDGPTGIMDRKGNWVLAPEYVTIYSEDDFYIAETEDERILLSGKLEKLYSSDIDSNDGYIRKNNGHSPDEDYFLLTNWTANTFFKVLLDGTVIENPNGMRDLQWVNGDLYSCYFDQPGSGDFTYTMALYDMHKEEYVIEPGAYYSISPVYDLSYQNVLAVAAYHQIRNTYVSDIFDLDGNLLVKNVSNIYAAYEDALLVKKGFSVGLMDYEGNWLYKTGAWNALND